MGELSDEQRRRLAEVVRAQTAAPPPTLARRALRWLPVALWASAVVVVIAFALGLIDG